MLSGRGGGAGMMVRALVLAVVAVAILCSQTAGAKKLVSRPFGVILYDEVNYEGRPQYLPIGVWVLKSEGAEGKARFASAKIFPGTQVTFYENRNFTGVQTLPVTGDIPSFQFSRIDGLTASVIVEYSAGVTVFEDAALKGNFHFLPPGVHNLHDLGFSHMTSSFVVGPLTKAEFFSEPDLGGEKLESFQSEKSLSPEWNDKVASVRISPVTSILLFEEPMFQGSAQYFGIGRHSHSAISQPDKLGSLKVQRDLRVTFYTDDNFSGRAISLDHDWNNFTTLGFTSIKGLVVDALCNPPCQHGKCVAPNKCACDTNWEGAVCDQAICNPKCKNGVCVYRRETFFCNCYSGWLGETCERATCSFPCKQGTCRQPDLCECQTGWMGQSCDKLAPVCGDDVCDPGHETCASCPRDCGGCPEKSRKKPREVKKDTTSENPPKKEYRPLIIISIVILFGMVLVTLILKYLTVRVDRKSSLGKMKRGKLD